MQGKGLPCSPLWRAVGPKGKFTKMQWRGELKAKLGDFAPNKFHILELITKFYKIPTILIKTERVHILTFYRNLEI